MNNIKQISFSLCGAVALSLCASINAEEVATHSIDAAEKILLMETINVTSDKDIAAEDETSGDPEVDQILNLADSLAMMSENLDEDSISIEIEDQSIEDTVESEELPTDSESSDKLNTSVKSTQPHADETQSHQTDSEELSDEEFNRKN